MHQRRYNDNLDHREGKYPPRQAKQAIQKTRKFLIRAAGPEAPVRACLRASAAPSMTESGTEPPIVGQLIPLLQAYRSQVPLAEIDIDIAHEEKNKHGNCEDVSTLVVTLRRSHILAICMRSIVMALGSWSVVTAPCSWRSRAAALLVGGFHYCCCSRSEWLAWRAASLALWRWDESVG